MELPELRLIAAAVDVPPGSLKRVDDAGVPICLARVEDGRLFAISDTCSHEEASLSEGILEGTEVECPWHSSIFDLNTGSVHGPPATEPIKTYDVVERDGCVYIRT